MVWNFCSKNGSVSLVPTAEGTARKEQDRVWAAIVEVISACCVIMSELTALPSKC